MTDTVRQTIRDRVITELNTDLPTGIPECTTRRFIPGEKIREARIAAFFNDEDDGDVGGAGGALTAHSLVLALQVIVPVEDPAEADDAIEPMLAHICERLGETNLNRLATRVRPMNTLWATANDGGVFVIVSLMRWRINYQSVRNDLTRRS